MSIWSIIKNAFKQNWKPGAVIWSVGLTFVLTYYFYEPFANSLEIVARLKSEGGFLFSFVVTAIFGGLIPYLYQVFIDPPRTKLLGVVTGIYLVVYWGWHGVEVDALYRLQAMLFGHEVSALNLIRKTVLDMGTYGTLWSPVLTLLVTTFAQVEFSRSRFKKQLDRSFWTQKLPSLIISGWFVWIPTVMLVYSLPLLLQVPMAILVNCFWTILVLYLSKN